MKNAKENAKRWLDQSEHDLISAKNNLNIHQFFSDACFMAEQSSQKALKSYLFFKGERYILVHSIQELVLKCASFEKEFEKFISYGKILDKYYIPTRYPDALAPPAVPYKSFTEDEAKEAVRYANEILEFVKERIK